MSQTDALGRVLAFDYESVPGSTKITYPNGSVSMQSYAFGALSSVTKGWGTPEAATWDYSYDPVTLGVTEVVDPNGHVTTATYDGAGNQLSRTDALGRTTTASYNDLGLPLTVTDASGVTTTFEYDLAGNLLSTSTPLVGSDPPAERRTAFHYGDPLHPGDVTSMTDPAGAIWTYAYHGDGSVESATDPLGHTTSFGVDGLGRITSIVSARGNVAGADPAQFTSTITYDAAGAPLVHTDPLGRQTTRTYDDNGNLKTMEDPEGNTTTYDYDAENQPLSTIRADQTVIATSYDDNGNIQTQTDAASGTTTYGYDALDRVVSVTDPLGRITSHGYDGAGNVITKQDPGGDCSATPEVGCTRFGHDPGNQLTTVTYSDGVTPNVEMSYDANGRRTGMIDGTGTSSWSYDSLGRLTSATDGSGRTTGYHHDLRGLITAIDYPSSAGAVVRAYDAAGRLTSVTDWLANTTTFDADAEGNTETVAFPAATGMVDTYAYNEAGELMSILAARNDVSTASFSYTRDSRGLVSSVTSTGVPADTHTYDYDPIGRLTATDSTTNAYDDADNPTAIDPTTQQFDAANQLCWTAPGPSSASCATPPAEATTYAYDARGNRTEVHPPAGYGRALRYDQANRLAEVAPARSTGNFTPITPSRVLDTRSAYRQGDCHTSVCDRLEGGETMTVQVAGRGGIPAAGVEAVAVTINTLSPSMGSYLTMYPSDGPRPAAVSASWIPNQTSTNHVIAKLGPAGAVKIWNQQGTVEIHLDVSGWYSASSDGKGFHAMRPTRIFDTRAPYHTGQCPPDASCTALKAGNANVKKFQVTGRGGIPTTGVSAVAITLTAWNVTGSTFVTVWSGDVARPTAAQMNLMANKVDSSFAIVKLAPDGTFSAYNNYGSLDLLGDVQGWYSDDGDLYQPMTPVRVLDTRSRHGECLGGCNTLAAKTTLNVKVAGRVGIPAEGVTAVVATVAAVVPSTGVGGYLTAWNADATRPATCNLNYLPNETRSETSVIKLAPDGTINVWASTGPTNVYIDIQGYYLEQPATSSYTYDGDGLRTAKTTTAHTTNHTWDRASGLPLLLGSHDTQGDTWLIYGTSRLPIAQINADDTIWWYHHDQLGSTRALSDASGTTIATYTYTPHGAPEASTGTATPLLGWAGEQTDTETGLVYLRARHYDPATGQFLNRDPIEALTRQPYAYADNNPINNTDPLGLFCVGPLCTEDVVEVVDDAWDKAYEETTDFADDAWDAAYEHRVGIMQGGSVVLGVGAIVVTGGTASFLLAGGSAFLAVGAEAADSKPCRGQRITQTAALAGAGLLGGVLWKGASQAADMATDAASARFADNIGRAFGVGDLMTTLVPDPCGC